MAESTREPPLLPLWQGDPLPPLPAGCTFAVTPGRWAALGSCSAAAVEATLQAAQSALEQGGDVAVFVHGAVGAAGAIAPPCYADAEGEVADRLGALADVDGARTAMVVVVEPRGTVWAVHLISED